jgi:hypothetical protein
LFDGEKGKIEATPPASMSIPKLAE